MGGEHDAMITTRLPTALKKRFKDACAVGISPLDTSKVCRVFIEPYCEFTERQKRQPGSFRELCEWYLKTHKE